MKKYILPMAMLLLGLGLGWLFFGGSSENQVIQDHEQHGGANQQWTCSMHPQIMQAEPGDCPICGMDLIPAQNSESGLRPTEFKLSTNAMALANIQTSIVGNSSAEGNTVKLSGKIEENEEANAVQVSFLSGRIESLNVNYTGEKVNKGQLLAKVYSPELYAAQQELLTASSLKETQPKLYEAVRRKLKIWKLSEQQINAIEELGKVNETVPIYATVSGTVTQKLVEQGDYINQGQPLFKIADLNTVWANFDVYENQIELFKKGQAISITTNAYPHISFTGQVDFIDPVMNSKTRTLSLRAVLKNPENTLKPGMFVEGEVLIHRLNVEEGVTIPVSAVLWTGERSVVYVKTDPHQAIFEMREVTLGHEIGGHYTILEGLRQGDEIVTNGTFTIDAAAQLQGKKSMMNKQGGKSMTGHEGHIGMAETSPSEQDSGMPTMDRIQVPEKFQSQLKQLFKNYLNLKDALIDDDVKTVGNSANGLLSSLQKVEMALITDNEGHSQWMYLEKHIKSAANDMAATSDINEQRTRFQTLSEHLTKAITLFGINTKVYQQYCPMANGNKGGYWLSTEEKVLNPYFGDAMLSCGEVKQIIE
ncbi:efflux RND transporter periplasmic adaptor subunit [Sediminicola luteus]|uniref:Efflux transporter periplasmic adaptor subunit n=1 Tax=Sediminicola luteus TaxID=319238 RepID=A0A2A4G5W1_9FLAO|nr:efflux RND transporter periplasmic adaptor subunit [Sediminicola luteus]PCE64359.1 efflux transporter periplasmic adaptor subunit [Sediminicola luteus]